MAPRQRGAKWIAATVLGLAAAAGCRQILGIEQRTEGGEGARGGSGGSGGSGDGGDLCAAYCETLSEACSDTDVRQYASGDSCLATCAFLEPGEPGDTTKNTVQCRLAHAEQAQSGGTPSSLCPVAGPAGITPGGGDACGGICEAYCSLINVVCEGSFPGIFLNEDDCLEECRDIPSTKAPFNASVADGDTIECRVYHLTLATTTTNPHCLHAKGLEKCVAPVDGGSDGGDDGGYDAGL
jgi:hypothetical protein